MFQQYSSENHNSCSSCSRSSSSGECLELALLQEAVLPVPPPWPAYKFYFFFFFTFPRHLQCCTVNLPPKNSQGGNRFVFSCTTSPDLVHWMIRKVILEHFRNAALSSCSVSVSGMGEKKSCLGWGVKYSHVCVVMGFCWVWEQEKAQPGWLCEISLVILLVCVSAGFRKGRFLYCTNTFSSISGAVHTFLIIEDKIKRGHAVLISEYVICEKNPWLFCSIVWFLSVNLALYLTDPCTKTTHSPPY